MSKDIETHLRNTRKKTTKTNPKSRDSHVFNEEKFEQKEPVCPSSQQRRDHCFGLTNSKIDASFDPNPQQSQQIIHQRFCRTFRLVVCIGRIHYS
ncbi:hypothetical protein F511_46306 [Dorcoceras hygrometricum]|uniref:Uncharacterized protein n=1 Tax=Dorcoceras hygrometricum TaxID=472368 RepID=A0A2Z6ZUC2_9LAMI|nr:hypothetical protein F511_46306 [Dorcoceras hygrometricum]